MKTWRMRFAFWVTKAKDTHLEYVIVIGFLQQQWFLERALMLCLYVHCLSCLACLRAITSRGCINEAVNTMRLVAMVVGVWFVGG
jgi:hypothetical protein